MKAGLFAASRVALLRLSALSFVCSIALFGCSGSTGDGGAVTVDKAVPALEVKHWSPKDFEALHKRQGLSAMDVEAYTEWFYSCHVDLDTEDVFQDDTSGASSLAIKVKRVKFKLAMPITVNLPAKVPAALKEHEDGHVLVCMLIYGNLDKVALGAANQVLGKTFNGMGKDLPEARNMAIRQINQIISQSFQEGSSTLADQASQKYDHLCEQYEGEPKMTRESLARSAVSEVQNNSFKVIQ